MEGRGAFRGGHFATPDIRDKPRAVGLLSSVRSDRKVERKNRGVRGKKRGHRTRHRTQHTASARRRRGFRRSEIHGLNAFIASVQDCGTIARANGEYYVTPDIVRHVLGSYILENPVT
jgi:hypothetical protein